MSISSLFGKVILAGGKYGIKKFIDEPPIFRAIEKTDKEFNGNGSVKFSLDKWRNSEEFMQILEELNAGAREVVDDEIVNSFTRQSDFHTGDETDMDARKVLTTFASNLAEEFYKEKDGVARLGARIEALSALQGKDFERMMQMLSSINESQKLITERSSALRKQWRPLEIMKYAVLNDNESGRSNFANDIAYALSQTFKGKKYVKFNALLQTSYGSAEGQSIPIYELVCHQVEFCDALRQQRMHLIVQLMNDDTPEGRAELKRRDLQRLTAFFKDWSLDCKLNFVSPYLPLEITYDGATKYIKLRILDLLPFKAINYPGKLSTTSEMLHFVASLIHTAPLLQLDDMDWFLKHYSTTKLLVDLIDKREIALHNLQVNTDDYEEWDYINSEFDVEVERYEVRAPNKTPILG